MWNKLKNSLKFIQIVLFVSAFIGFVSAFVINSYFIYQHNQFLQSTANCAGNTFHSIQYWWNDHCFTSPFVSAIQPFLQKEFGLIVCILIIAFLLLIIERRMKQYYRNQTLDHVLILISFLLGTCAYFYSFVHNALLISVAFSCMGICILYVIRKLLIAKNTHEEQTKSESTKNSNVDISKFIWRQYLPIQSKKDLGISDATDNTNTPTIMQQVRQVSIWLQDFITYEREHPFTLSVEAPWGGGKTSFINVLREEMINTQKRTVSWIDYQPWAYSTEYELYTDFFREINCKLIEKHGVSLTSNLDTYVELVTKATDGIDNLFITVIKNISQLFFRNNKTRDEMFSEIKKSLLSTNETFIITFDDVDRMEPTQIVSLLRLIIAISNLPRFVFILCIDYERVDAIISHHFGTAEYNGFLQKIIQSRIQLPPRSYQKVMTTLQNLTGVTGNTPNAVTSIEQILSNIILYVESRFTRNETDILHRGVNPAIPNLMSTNIEFEYFSRLLSYINIPIFPTMNLPEVFRRIDDQADETSQHFFVQRLRDIRNKILNRDYDNFDEYFDAVQHVMYIYYIYVLIVTNLRNFGDRLQTIFLTATSNIDETTKNTLIPQILHNFGPPRVDTNYFNFIERIANLPRDMNQELIDQYQRELDRRIRESFDNIVNFTDELRKKFDEERDKSTTELFTDIRNIDIRRDGFKDAYVAGRFTYRDITNLAELFKKRNIKDEQSYNEQRTHVEQWLEDTIVSRFRT